MLIFLESLDSEFQFTMIHNHDEWLQLRELGEFEDTNWAHKLANRPKKRKLKEKTAIFFPMMLAFKDGKILAGTSRFLRYEWWSPYNPRNMQNDLLWSWGYPLRLDSTGAPVAGAGETEGLPTELPEGFLRDFRDWCLKTDNQNWFNGVMAGDSNFKVLKPGEIGKLWKAADDEHTMSGKGGLPGFADLAKYFGQPSHEEPDPQDEDEDEDFEDLGKAW